MIEEIYIRDLGVIEEARLKLGPGLTVVTGETGAGKTMVLTALGLLLGERADSSSIRTGQEQAFVEGRWLLKDSENLGKRLDEAGASLEDGELIMNRSVSNEGRSRASVSGRATPVSVLFDIGEQLVVVHGQADQIRLKSATAQRQALDQFSGSDLSTVLASYQSHYRAWKSSKAQLEAITSALETRLTEAEQLRIAVAELEAAQPQLGEDVVLSEKAERLTHLEELRQAATTAHEAISSEDFQDGQDALTLLGQARRALEQVGNHDSELQRISETIREVGFQLNDIAAEISGYVDGLEGDGAKDLELIQERRAVLNSLARRFGPSHEEVLAFWTTASNRLLELDSSSDQIDTLSAQVSAEYEAMRLLADEVSEIRRVNASDLAEQVSQELKSLAMAGATLVVSVSRASDFGPTGIDEVAIMLSAHAGAEPRALGKGASGGELSRIMLAIEVVLAKTEQAPTFIFDEVDAGVGGAAAIEVGRRLAMLAQQAQVIVVTHLAQVAAYANSHLRVLKSSAGGFTASDVVALDPEQRVAELARMLSGLTDSQSGLAHAAELLERAHSEFSK
ncbi:MAG: repair protein RecN [Actinomycetota bacterium]